MVRITIARLKKNKAAGAQPSGRKFDVAFGVGQRLRHSALAFTPVDERLVTIASKLHFLTQRLFASLPRCDQGCIF